VVPIEAIFYIFLSDHQELLFCCEGDQTLAQISQRCCGVLLLGDTQKLSRHGPGQQSLGVPA